MRPVVSFIAHETDTVEIMEAIDLHDVVYIEHENIFYALYTKGDDGVIEKRYRIDGQYTTLKVYSGRLQFAYAIYRIMKAAKYE
jgi:hypothetical protein